MTAGPLIDTFPVGPLQCNCTVLADPRTREAIVIDPGDEAERILRALESEKLSAVALLHTHAHLDHITASRAVKEATGAPIRLHPGDRPLYDALPEQAAFFGLRADAPAQPSPATPTVTSSHPVRNRPGSQGFSAVDWAKPRASPSTNPAATTIAIALSN